MSDEDAVVIGRLSASMVFAWLVGVLTLTGFFVWLSYVHGYAPARTGEVEFGSSLFYPIFFGAALTLWSLGANVVSLVFRGGVGLEIRNRQLIYLFPSYRTTPLSFVESVSLASPVVVSKTWWKSVRLRSRSKVIVVKLKGQQKEFVYLTFFKDDPSKMLERLGACGLTVLADDSVPHVIEVGT